MAAVQDVFSMSYTGLWNVLEASPSFIDAIPAQNRIRYDHKTIRQPDKTPGPYNIALSADRPQVGLVPMGGSEFLLISSSSTKFIKRYQLQVALGDLRVNTWLYPLEFIIAAALTAWQPILFPLTWQGDQFIKVLRVDGVQEGKTAADLEKGINGWSTRFNLSLEMWLTSSKLQNLQAGSVLIGDANLPPNV